MKNKILAIFFFLLVWLNAIFANSSEQVSSSQLRVIHQLQEENLCIPTVASMMLERQGKNYTPRHIKALTKSDFYDPSAPFNDFTPTVYKDLFAALQKIGVKWDGRLFENNKAGFEKGMQQIKDSIKMNYPVMISIGEPSGIGHCVLVAGFNDINQMLSIVDPSIPNNGYRMISYDDFENKYWLGRSSKSRSRMAVFMY
jgi:hypothetical protein